MTVIRRRNQPALDAMPRLADIDVSAEVMTATQALLDYMHDDPNPIVIGARCSEVSQVMTLLLQHASALRRGQARRLWGDGWTMEEIGEAWRVTRARVQQIIGT